MDRQVGATERALGMSLCLLRQRGQALYWTQRSVSLGPGPTAGLCRCPCPHLPTAHPRCGPLGQAAAPS